MAELADAEALKASSFRSVGSNPTGGTMAQKHIELYRSPNKVKILHGLSLTLRLLQQWRYRVVAANGQNVGNPGQAYTRKSSAIRAARREHPGLPITEE